MIDALLHPIQFRRDHVFTVDHASDYVDGALDPDGTHRVEHHASRCPKCAQFLQSLKRTVVALRTLAAPASPLSEPAPSIAADVVAAFRRQTRPPGGGSP